MAKVLTDKEIQTLKSLKEIQKEESVASQVPLGYLPMRLSTKGKLGAPEVFHIRNFKTTDLLDIALTSEEDLPEAVVKMIDGMIFEEDISVKDWHEKEVTELLVRLYMLYFSPVMNDIDFQPTQEDWDFLKNQVGPTSFANMLADFEEKRWVPKTSINLSTIETHDLDDNFNPILHLQSKKTGLSIKFTFPRFGDVLIVKKLIKKVFEKEEKQFAQIKKMIEYKNEAEKKFREGKLSDLSKIPTIPEAEFERYKDYSVEKALYSVDAIRSLHILSFDGKDYSKASLEERISLMKDARLDHILFKKAEEYFNSLKIGINDEKIKMFNPITNEDVVRRFSFRLVDILQAIKVCDTDEYVVVSDAENGE